MNKFVLITVACMRQSQNKGHRLVIEALTKLANPNILYLIVGEGVDKKNIEKYAKKCGVAHQIRFLGFVDEDIMPDLYNSADVAVLISRSEYGLGEGVPLGLLEAAACGLPVICGNEDGSIEIINHQVDMPNGFAVNPRKVSEVVHKIETYNNNRELLKQHGENSRKYIKSLFCYQSFVKRQKDILKGMLNAA
jgi:glycosyltransferase involved in cell wall biosynthesis